MLFLAFLQETVIESWAKEQPDPDASKSLGYDSLAIIYAVFAISNWIAPPVVSLIGPRFSMFFAGLVYSGFIFSFLYIQPWLLLTLSALLGVAAAGKFIQQLNDMQFITSTELVFKVYFFLL